MPVETPPSIEFDNSNPASITFIAEDPEEPTYNSHSWECQDDYSAYAQLNDGAQYPASQWMVEASNSCSAHGSALKQQQEINPEHKPDGAVIPLTGNSVYQPNTYAGWVMVQLGLI